jgi:hypothetical protein
MKIFLGGFAAAACLAGDFFIAELGSVMTPALLNVAAHVASVMMVVALMAGVRTLVVVVPTRFVDLIARVPTALFVRMPSVLTVHVAGLKTLVLAWGETLLLAHIVGVSLAVATRIIFVLTTSVVLARSARPIGPALLCKMAELVVILLLNLVAHLTLCVGLNFVKLIVRNKAFAQARVVDQLKVLCEHMGCLLT